MSCKRDGEMFLIRNVLVPQFVDCQSVGFVLWHVNQTTGRKGWNEERKTQGWVTQQHIKETKRSKDNAAVWQIMHGNVTSIRLICIVFQLKQTWSTCQLAGTPDGTSVSIIVRHLHECVWTHINILYMCFCLYLYLLVLPWLQRECSCLQGLNLYPVLAAYKVCWLLHITSSKAQFWP